MTVAVLTHDLTGAGVIGERIRDGLRAEIVSDLASVEALWRGIEADPAALGTPYQRFDWVSAYVRATIGPDPSAEAAALRVVILRDGSGRPRALLPLMVSRERGARVARIIGGRHANYHMPLFASREAAAMRGQDLADTLSLIGREAGIDVYALSHQPRFWDGAANPLSERGETGASDAYGLLLGPDAESTARRVFSADARKKLRSKEKKLAEAHGPLAYRMAETPEEAASFLAAFYAQKAARFAGMGVPDPYADPAMRRFLAEALAPATGGGSPAMEIHALLARDGGRVFATFAGAVDGARYSGMATSFDQDPAVSRSSPGDLLLHHLIQDQAARGRRAFDLGVGEARYKASICDETIALCDVILPVTFVGHLFAAQAVGAARLKRRIKRDPRLWALAQRLRRLVRPAS